MVKKQKQLVAYAGRSRRTRDTPKAAFLHHSHSFKLVHHRHTHYPLVAFILLVAAIFSVGWTNFAHGDSYQVTATVPAQTLTEPATITSPVNGASFIMDVITVNGECPKSSYVKLTRNQNFVGAAICQADNTWSIQTTLLVGSNYFEAQAYNVIDQPGPIASGVTVSYLPPTATASAGADKAQVADVSPLLISSSLTYRGYFTNQLSRWPMSLSGGKGPYAIQIDWGDSSTDVKDLDVAGDFELEHSYAQAGGFKNSYTITVTARDALGQTSIIQLFTIIAPSSGDSAVDNAGGGVVGLTGETNGPTSGQTGSLYQKFWNVAGPTYVATTIAMASFWLGGHGGMAALGARGFKFPFHILHR